MKSEKNPGEKNKLVSLGANQTNPYVAEGSDFSVKKVMPANKQSGGHGDAEGKNKLASQSHNQEGARHAEDGGEKKGSGVPVPGDYTAIQSGNFPVGKNSGESDEGSPSKMSIEEYVDLEKGYVCASGKRTRVDEVPQNNVSIAGR